MRYRVDQVCCACAQFYGCALHADKTVFGIELRCGFDEVEYSDRLPGKLEP